LPPCAGKPIRISYRKPLLVRRGALVSEGGQEMHAATFLRRRHMVLDGELLGNEREWRRIFVHEVFHFAWVRLGNAARASWRALLAEEWRSRARGELGWSAELRKKELSGRDVAGEGPRWKDYTCESFCDTAAWMYARAGRHEEFTLAARWRKPRASWFRERFGDRAVPL